MKPKLLRLSLVAGAGALVYGLAEPFRHGITRHDVPVRWDGAPLDVLHLSDTHLAPTDRKLRRFLHDLPAQLPKVPDLVVATGDLIQGNEGIDPFVEAVAGLDAKVGRFYVLGSHDYFVGSGPSYSKYFSGEKTVRRAKHADSARLEQRLQEQGWISLRNRSERVQVEGRAVLIAGVDDPYLQRHDVGHIHRSGVDELAIGMMHAPDITSQWALNGFDLVLAGHTHAGQVRIPGLGAVVTNCSLPAALAGGLNRVGSTWLHVSPGLGTGKYAPIRFLAPPEATLLTLVPSR